MKHVIKVRRVTVTLLEVEAPNAKAALTQIREYGDIQAASDYKTILETVEAGVSYCGLVKDRT